VTRSEKIDPLFEPRLPLLNPNKPVPLYHQIYVAIRQKIQSGDLPTGSKIPGELQLAEQLDVSRITVKRALNELAQSGLVTRQRGRGTIVTANTDLNFNDSGRDYVKNVEKLRNTTQAIIISREIVTAPSSVSANLELPNKTEVEKIAHCLQLEKKILSYVETFLPLGLTDGLTNTELKEASLLTLLNRKNITAKRAEQTILPVSASEVVAQALDATEGLPLLKIHCVMYDYDNRPIQDIYAWYHPDRYKYKMTLENLDGANLTHRKAKK